MKLRAAIFLFVLFVTGSILRATPVQPHYQSGAWGVGRILGKPIRGEFRGLVFKTFEMNVITGNFPDSTLFSGNVHHVSTRDPEIFERFQGLDENKNYLFDYWRPRLQSLYMNDSWQFITSIEPAPSDRRPLDVPHSVSVEGGPEGRYAPKGHSIKKGRIVRTERWTSYLTGQNLCMFVLDMGGRGSQRYCDEPAANEASFNVYSEEACQYVENILPYGATVQVEFSQAYATLDWNDRIAHRISIDEPHEAPEDASFLHID